MAQQQQTLILQGGLDLVTPSLAIRPERMISCLNYECEARGYRSVMGYERYDGQPKPSNAAFWDLPFDTGSTAFAVGQVVTGATSGATGTVLALASLASGSWAAGDATGRVALHTVTGTFQLNETLNVSASPVARATGTPTFNVAETDALTETYLETEAERRRALIQPVPGSGPVRGVVIYGVFVYAFRDNAAGTAGVMHRATATGWQAVTFPSLLRFDAGTAAFAEGETVTGGTSGATATIARLAHQDNPWSGTATGYLVLTGITGTFQNNEAISSASGAAVVNGTLEAVTLAPGGHYEFDVHNFYGALFAPRLYFAYGTGPAMEFDGIVAAPVETGLPASFEKPTHIAQHQNHLFLGYGAGTLNFSAPGEPLAFDSTRGAGSADFGLACTGLLPSTQTALVVLGRERVSYVAGTSAADFQVQTVTDEAGCIEWSAQRLAQPIYVDNRGIRDLADTEAYGGFRAGTKSRNIEPVFALKRATGARVAASLRVRARDQYRLFYDDGTGIAMYLGRKDPEFTTFTLPQAMFSMWSGDIEILGEILLGGGADGYVYQLDTGTSFDGAPIETMLRLPFNSLGNPQQDKRYHKLIVEVDAATDTDIFVVADFAYGSPVLQSAQGETFTVTGGGGFWNEAFWDLFYWSSQVQGIAEAHIAGIGSNISVAVASTETRRRPHTLSTLTVLFTPRRRLR